MSTENSPLPSASISGLVSSITWPGMLQQQPLPPPTKRARSNLHKIPSNTTSSSAPASSATSSGCVVSSNLPPTPSPLGCGSSSVSSSSSGGEPCTPAEQRTGLSPQDISYQSFHPHVPTDTNQVYPDTVDGQLYDDFEGTLNSQPGPAVLFNKGFDQGEDDDGLPHDLFPGVDSVRGFIGGSFPSPSKPTYHQHLDLQTDTWQADAYSDSYNTPDATPFFGPGEEEESSNDGFAHPPPLLPAALDLEFSQPKSMAAIQHDNAVISQQGNVSPSWPRNATPKRRNTADQRLRRTASTASLSTPVEMEGSLRVKRDVASNPSVRIKQMRQTGHLVNEGDGLFRDKMGGETHERRALKRGMLAPLYSEEFKDMVTKHKGWMNEMDRILGMYVDMTEPSSLTPDNIQKAVYLNARVLRLPVRGGRSTTCYQPFLLMHIHSARDCWMKSTCHIENTVASVAGINFSWLQFRDELRKLTLDFTSKPPAPFNPVQPYGDPNGDGSEHLAMMPYLSYLGKTPSEICSCIWKLFLSMPRTFKQLDPFQPRDNDLLGLLANDINPWFSRCGVCVPLPWEGYFRQHLSGDDKEFTSRSREIGVAKVIAMIFFAFMCSRAFCMDTTLLIDSRPSKSIQHQLGYGLHGSVASSSNGSQAAAPALSSLTNLQTIQQQSAFTRTKNVSSATSRAVTKTVTRRRQQQQPQQRQKQQQQQVRQQQQQQQMCMQQQFVPNLPSHSEATTESTVQTVSMPFLPHLAAAAAAAAAANKSKPGMFPGYNGVVVKSLCAPSVNASFGPGASVMQPQVNMYYSGISVPHTIQSTPPEQQQSQQMRTQQQFPAQCLPEQQQQQQQQRA